MEEEEGQEGGVGGAGVVVSALGPQPAAPLPGQRSRLGSPV